MPEVGARKGVEKRADGLVDAKSGGAFNRVKSGPSASIQTPHKSLSYQEVSTNSLPTSSESLVSLPSSDEQFSQHLPPQLYDQNYNPNYSHQLMQYQEQQQQLQQQQHQQPSGMPSAPVDQAAQLRQLEALRAQLAQQQNLFAQQQRQTGPF